MNRNSRNVAALGILTIIAVGVFFWGLYYLLGNSILTGGSNIVVELPSGGGMKRGDRVMLHGTIVGTVKRVELVPQGVDATLRLNQKMDLGVDTKASVIGDVFGAHWVELTPGSAQAKLTEADTIKGTVAAQLVDQASGLATNAQTILQRTDSLLSTQAIANLHATAAELPGSAVELRATLKELRATSAALRQAAQGLQSAKTAEAATAAVQRIDSLASRISVDATTLNESLVSMRSVFGKIDRGQGTLGKLVNDTSLYAELHSAAAAFRSLAVDLKANPKRYIDLKIF
jgi:phospholipid/cholesterol/gamma-HCH transport system substrate-binding protein